MTNRVFVPTRLKRTLAINFASRYCHHMIITAGGSTFGWMGAYLMPFELQNNVYFNPHLFKPNVTKDFRARYKEDDYFLPEWNRLVWDQVQKTMRVESRQLPYPSTRDMFA